MTQAFNLSQFANKVNTSGQASLTTAVTGTLPVANGGTGAATLTTNNVLLGNGTSALQVVAPSTAGNVLTSNGTTWSSAAVSMPAGSVLQVLSTAKTDTFSTGSTSFVDVTGMSVTITPSSASNKILIMVGSQVSMNSADCTTVKILRGSTDIFIGDAAGSRPRVSSSKSFASNGIEAAPIIYLDSPATTSATTYKLQMRLASGTAYLNRSSSDGDNSAHPRTASSITVMEIKG
jgi:hypothetical protein